MSALTLTLMRGLGVAIVGWTVLAEAFGLFSEAAIWPVLFSEPYPLVNWLRFGVGALAAVLAGIVGLVLLFFAGDRSDAVALAFTLILAYFSLAEYDSLHFITSQAQTEFGRDRTLLVGLPLLTFRAVFFSALVLAAGTAMQFSMLFPRPLPPPASPGPGGNGTRGTLLAPFLSLEVALFNRTQFWSCLSTIGLVSFLLARPWVQEGWGAWWGIGQSRWIMVGALGVDVGGLIGLLKVGIWFLTGIGVGAFVLRNLARSYRISAQEQRRRLLWVVVGVVGGVVLLSLGLSLWILEALGFLQTWRMPPTSFPLLLPTVFGNRALMLIPITVGASLGLFYSGVFNPALVIRRTTVYGALAVLFLFLFAGLGNLAQAWLEQTLGMSASLGSWMTGGTVAVALIPVKHRLDRFMNRILPVTVLAEAPVRPVTILFSDIVGYTSVTGDDQKTALTMMSVFHKAADRVARENRGRLVKTVADEVVLAFDDPHSALRAASDLEDDFHRGASKLELPLAALRTGIHYGEVTHSHDGDVFGQTVNIASRLQGVAEPGQIVVSQAFVATLDPAIRFDELGEKRLKNVGESVVCYAVPR